jgi:hypothetical protein
LAAFVSTPYALVIQWDGYVVDPAVWRDKFRAYDYIGAPIPTKEGEVVGNGGFSWRSRKLMAAASALPVVKQIPEDVLISVTFRRTLEREIGVRFAPLDLARVFSHELGPHSGPTFGFHGQFNLWRHETDEEVLRIFNSKPKGTVFSRDSFALVAMCLGHGRRNLAERLYALLRQERGPDSMWRYLRRWQVPRKAFKLTVDALEGSVDRHAAARPRTDVSDAV